MFLRKGLLLGAAALMFVLSAGAAAHAAAASVNVSENIGVVDLDQVTNNHPGMNEARQQLAALSRQKENEARTAADKETDAAKKAQAIQTKRMELVEAQQKLMEPIFTDCQRAVREVATRKKLTLILNKSVVLIGGTDITQDVIQQLAKGKADSGAKKK